MLTRSSCQETGTTIGIASMIPKDFPEANLNQALGHIVLKFFLCELNEKPIEINKEYVLTYLNSKFGKTQVLRYGGFRAGQGWLSTGEVKSLLIPLFDEPIQRKIMEQINEHRTKAYSYGKRFYEKAEEITFLLENVLGEVMPRKSQKTFLCYPQNFSDRIDCLYNSPDIIKLQAYLSKLEKKEKFS